MKVQADVGVLYRYSRYSRNDVNRLKVLHKRKSPQNYFLHFCFVCSYVQQNVPYDNYIRMYTDYVYARMVSKMEALHKWDSSALMGPDPRIRSLLGFSWKLGSLVLQLLHYLTHQHFPKTVSVIVTSFFIQNSILTFVCLFHVTVISKFGIFIRIEVSNMQKK